MINQSTPIIDHLSALVKLKSLPNDLDFIENLANSLSTDLGLKIVKTIDHKFEPVGRTLLCILSESHLAIHTWPEHNTLHIDLLSCGGTKITDFDKALTGALEKWEFVDYKSEKCLI